MRKLFRFLGWTALVIGVLVGASRALLLRWWELPGDDPVLEASVTPSVRGGDLLLLWRATAPKLGDLVVCPEPDPEDPDRARDDGRIVIGRIVAEGGQRVRFDSSDVYVDDRKAPTERQCTEGPFKVNDPQSGVEVQQNCQIEVLGRQHMRGATLGHNQKPVMAAPYEVPEGRVFLVSDNRLFPYDSRDYGSVKASHCTETVFFRLTSAKGFGDVGSRLSFIN